MPTDRREYIPQGPSRSGIGSAVIEKAEILDFDEDTNTVRVLTEHTERPVEGVEIVSLYCHPDGPEDGAPKPQQGAQILLIWPSDGSNPVAFGYVMPPGRNGNRGGRTRYASGTIPFVTRTGSKVVLHAGGTIEIAANAFCKSLYIPTTGIIRHFFKQTTSSTILGEQGWVHEPRDPVNPPEKTKELFYFRTKQFVEDEESTFKLEIGSVEANLAEGSEGNVSSASTVLELKISPPNEGDNLVIRMDTEGNVHFRMQALDLKMSGAVTINTEDRVEWEGAGGFLLKIEENADMHLKVGEMTIEAFRDMMIEVSKGTLALVSDDIALGRTNTSDLLLKGNTFLAHYATHTHPNKGAGPPIGFGTPNKYLTTKPRIRV